MAAKSNQTQPLTKVSSTRTASNCFVAAFHTTFPALSVTFFQTASTGVGNTSKSTKKYAEMPTLVALSTYRFTPVACVVNGQCPPIVKVRRLNASTVIGGRGLFRRCRFLHMHLTRAVPANLLGSSRAPWS